MAETKKDEILELVTKVVRPIITIRKRQEDVPVEYQMKLANEFSMADYHKLAHRGRRLQTLMLKESLTKKETAELETITAKFLEPVLLAPAEIVATLSDTQKVQIIHLFYKLSDMGEMGQVPEGQSTPQS